MSSSREHPNPATPAPAGYRLVWRLMPLHWAARPEGAAQVRRGVIGAAARGDAEPEGGSDSLRHLGQKLHGVTPLDLEPLRTREAREEELKRRQTHYAELKEQFARERERVRRTPAPSALRPPGNGPVFPGGRRVGVPTCPGWLRHRLT